MKAGVRSKLVPISDSGKMMTRPEEGFIVVGNIYVAEVGEDGRPRGGLIGNAFPVTRCRHEKFALGDVKTYVFTRQEFLQALCIEPEDLRGLADDIENECHGRQMGNETRGMENND